MIEVYAEKAGPKCRMLVTGHASQGPERDVVCAGVSALVSSLVFYATAAPACRHLRYSMEPGEVFLSCTGLGESFVLVLRGLDAIAQAHPAHLKINSMPSVDDKSKKA